MKIDEFQKEMANFVLHGNQSIILEKICKHSPHEDLVARLKIYQNNTFHSLIEALKSLYPSLVETIGPDLFASMGKQFIKAHPPKQAAMVYFGHDFPLFLSSHAEIDQYAYLPDLATLDLLYHRSYHAKDEQALDQANFAELDIERLTNSKIQAVDSAKILGSKFAIFDIWQLAQGNNENNVDAKKQQYVLVIRPHNEVYIHNISDGIFVFLRSLNQQMTIGEALGKADDASNAFSPTEAITFLIQSGFANKITGEQQ